MGLLFKSWWLLEYLLLTEQTLQALSAVCALLGHTHFSLSKAESKALGSPPAQQSLQWVHGHSNMMSVCSVRGMDCNISKPYSGVSVKHGFIIYQAARELALWYRQDRRRQLRSTPSHSAVQGRAPLQGPCHNIKQSMARREILGTAQSTSSYLSSTQNTFSSSPI